MSVVTYGAATSVVSGRPSPKIWADCPVIPFLKDPGKGFHWFEDFLQPATGATTVAGHRFYSYIIGSGAITLADDPKGALVLDHNDTDNDEVAITTGNNTTGLVIPADGSSTKWWFEARVKYNNIVAETNGDVAFFVGLTE